MRTLAQWSLKEYHSMIEAGILGDRQVELIEGEIVVRSPESPLHSNVYSDVYAYLTIVLQGRAKVRGGTSITLATSEPQPDLAIVEDKSYRVHHPTPEDIFWLIEISRSTLNYDLNDKKRLYATASIQEYWIVDLIKQELIVWRHPEDNDYKSQFTLKDGEIKALSFPDLVLDVKKIIGG